MPGYDDRRFAPPAPVASVVLRTPEGGEEIEAVPMLIDSGADTTLLPRTAAATLGIVGTGERFRLEAFDGTITEADVVQAVVVFLGRRFRGSFLLIDAEIGIIGRDLLNHVRLLLDGPAGAWQEWPPTVEDA